MRGLEFGVDFGRVAEKQQAKSEKGQWKDYNKNPKEGSAEKGGHKERSIANSPQHKEHWKK